MNQYYTRLTGQHGENMGKQSEYRRHGQDVAQKWAESERMRGMWQYTKQTLFGELFRARIISNL